MEQLAGLPEGAKKLALERFQMLRPHLEEKRSLRLVAAEADYSLSNGATLGCAVSAVWSDGAHSTEANG
jgi:hypothetical protein